MGYYHKKTSSNVTKCNRRHSLSHNKKTKVNESKIPDGMTEAEYLNMYLGNDSITDLPDEVLDILKRKVVDCLKANNIPIPQSLKGYC